MNTKSSSKSKNLLTVIILAAVAVILIATLVQGISVKTGENTIQLSGGLFYRETIPYADITSIEMSDAINYGTRTNGVSLLGLHIGRFHNTEFGSYHLFAQSSASDLIIVRHNDSITVFNAKSNQETEELYAKLSDITSMA